MTTSIDDATLDPLSVKGATLAAVYDPAMDATVFKIDSNSHHTTWGASAISGATRAAETWANTVQTVNGAVKRAIEAWGDL